MGSVPKRGRDKRDRGVIISVVILSCLYCLIINQLRCGVMVVIVFFEKEKRGKGKKKKKKCKKSVTTITSGHMPTNSMLQPIPFSQHLTLLHLKPANITLHQLFVFFGSDISVIYG